MNSNAQMYLLKMSARIVGQGFIVVAAAMLILGLKATTLIRLIKLDARWKESALNVLYLYLQIRIREGL